MTRSQFVTAILIGLASTEVAVALHFGVTVYLIAPFRQVARILFRHSSASKVDIIG